MRSSFSFSRRKLYSALVLGAAAASFSTPAAAGGVTSQEAMDRLQQEDWSGAAKAYKRLTRRNPDDGELWYHYGLSLLRSGQHERAIRAYERAEDLQFGVPVTRYNLACALALGGQVDAAFGALQGAFDAGYAHLEPLDSDPDLAALRADERFEAFTDQLRLQVRPCIADPIFEQLAFWVGTWEVTLTDGTKIGEDRVTRSPYGCVFLEEWWSVLGSRATGTTYYDRRSETWQLVYVDSASQTHTASGVWKDGAMRFTGEQHRHMGPELTFQSTWTPQPDGHILVTSSVSEDDGATWSVGREVVYRPMNNSPHSTEELP